MIDQYNQAHKVASPAVSQSTDGGHGAHCYDGDTLICGWPTEHNPMSVADYERGLGRVSPRYRSYMERTSRK